MLLSNKLVVQNIEIGDLRPHPSNLRIHPKKQRAKIRRLLEAYGQVSPVLISPDRLIIDHELVWEELKTLGAKTIDIIVVADKSPAELLALRIALNRSALDAMWHEPNVQTALDRLARVDFDLDLTGFDPPEIDSYLNLDIPGANVEENGSDIPPLGTIPVSEPGMVWELGKHRVGCGSATDLGFVRQVLADRSADCVFIDPPFNIPINGFISGKGRHRHREFVQGAGELSTEEYFAFLRNSLQVLQQCCEPSALIFSCIDWRHVTEMNIAARVCGMPLYNICVWTKNNGGMGGIYRNAHELICVFRAGSESPLNNVELGKFGRHRTNVWSYAGMSSFGKARDELLGLHPTVKPVAMIADALRDVTRRGEIVLDTFLGSGSTLMAAQETGRICCGVELDPCYVDVAIRRWQNATGLDAVVAGTGETFNATAQKLLAGPSGSTNGI